MQQVVIKPLVTEKSMKDVSLSKYTFMVSKDATKGAVKKALLDMFNVHVVSISTSITKGRKRVVGFRRRQVVNESMWKRATVSLRKGERISLFEPGSATEEEKKDKKKK